MAGEAFLLGISTGTYCALYCAPVILPFLFSEEARDGRKNGLHIALFMLGRLVGLPGHRLCPGAQRKPRAPRLFRPGSRRSSWQQCTSSWVRS